MSLIPPHSQYIVLDPNEQKQWLTQLRHQQHIARLKQVREQERVYATVLRETYENKKHSQADLERSVRKQLFEQQKAEQLAALQQQLHAATLEIGTAYNDALKQTEQIKQDILVHERTEQQDARVEAERFTDAYMKRKEELERPATVAAVKQEWKETAEKLSETARVKQAAAQQARKNALPEHLRNPFTAPLSCFPPLDKPIRNPDNIQVEKVEVSTTDSSAFDEAAKQREYDAAESARLQERSREAWERTRERGSIAAYKLQQEREYVAMESALRDIEEKDRLRKSSLHTITSLQHETTDVPSSSPLFNNTPYFLYGPHIQPAVKQSTIQHAFTETFMKPQQTTDENTHPNVQSKKAGTDGKKQELPMKRPTQRLLNQIFEQAFPELKEMTQHTTTGPDSHQPVMHTDESTANTTSSGETSNNSLYTTDASADETTDTSQNQAHQPASSRSRDSHKYDVSDSEYTPTDTTGTSHYTSDSTSDSRMKGATPSAGNTTDTSYNSSTATSTTRSSPFQTPYTSNASEYGYSTPSTSTDTESVSGTSYTGTTDHSSTNSSSARSLSSYTSYTTRDADTTAEYSPAAEPRKQQQRVHNLQSNKTSLSLTASLKAQPLQPVQKPQSYPISSSFTAPYSIDQTSNSFAAKVQLSPPTPLPQPATSFSASPAAAAAQAMSSAAFTNSAPNNYPAQLATPRTSATNSVMSTAKDPLSGGSTASNPGANKQTGAAAQASASQHSSARNMPPLSLASATRSATQARVDAMIQDLRSLKMIEPGELSDDDGREEGELWSYHTGAVADEDSIMGQPLNQEVLKWYQQQKQLKKSKQPIDSNRAANDLFNTPSRRKLGAHPAITPLASALSATLSPPTSPSDSDNDDDDTLSSLDTTPERSSHASPTKTAPKLASMSSPFRKSLGSQENVAKHQQLQNKFDTLMNDFYSLRLSKERDMFPATASRTETASSSNTSTARLSSNMSPLSPPSSEEDSLNSTDSSSDEFMKTINSIDASHTSALLPASYVATYKLNNVLKNTVDFLARTGKQLTGPQIAAASAASSSASQLNSGASTARTISSVSTAPSTASSNAGFGSAQPMNGQQDDEIERVLSSQISLDQLKQEQSKQMALLQQLKQQTSKQAWMSDAYTTASRHRSSSDESSELEHKYDSMQTDRSTASEAETNTTADTNSTGDSPSTPERSHELHDEEESVIYTPFNHKLTQLTEVAEELEQPDEVDRAAMEQYKLAIKSRAKQVIPSPVAPLQRAATGDAPTTVLGNTEAGMSLQEMFLAKKREFIAKKEAEAAQRLHGTPPSTASTKPKSKKKRVNRSSDSSLNSAVDTSVNSSLNSSARSSTQSNTTANSLDNTTTGTTSSSFTTTPLSHKSISLEPTQFSTFSPAFTSPVPHMHSAHSATPDAPFTASTLRKQSYDARSSSTKKQCKYSILHNFAFLATLIGLFTTSGWCCCCIYAM